MAFDIAWERTRLQWYRNSEHAPWQLSAVLLERILVAGKPALRCICRLSSILEDKIINAGAAERFWSSARKKLGKLRRLTPRDINEVELILAERVAKPVPIPQQAAE